MIKMRLRKTGEIVDVYAISPDIKGTSSRATVFIPSLESKANNGWVTLSVTRLCPNEYWKSENEKAITDIIKKWGIE